MLVVNDEKYLLFALKEKTSGLLNVASSDLILIEQSNIHLQGGGSEYIEEIVRLSPDVDGNIFILPEHNGKFLLIETGSLFFVTVIFPLDTFCKGMNIGTGEVYFQFDKYEEYSVEYPSAQAIFQAYERFQITTFRNEGTATAVIHIDPNPTIIEE